MDRLRQLADDDRAVSPVVGFVLIVALLVIVFTIYQSSVVPVQNEHVEFEHSRTVDGELGQLSSAIVETSSTGDPRSVTIDTGVEYPSRGFAINPGDPVGTLETVETGGVTLSGLRYGNGSYTFDTSFVDYHPNYVRLDDGASYSLENGMLLEGFSDTDTTLVKSVGTMFPAGGDRVDLVLVGGDLNRRALSTTVTTEAVSNRTVRSSAIENGRLTLPTTLPADRWRTLLSNRSQASFVGYSGAGSGIHRVTIALEDGTAIRVSRVSVGGSETVDEPPVKRYIENETPRRPTVTGNATVPLTVDLHDQFGSPITSGATLRARTTGAGSLNTSGVALDSDGRATVRYTPAAADAGETVTVRLGLENGTENGPATFELAYPQRKTRANGSSRRPIPVRGIETGGTNRLGFEIVPGKPVAVAGFSVVTKGDAEALNGTSRDNRFRIADTRRLGNASRGPGPLRYAAAEPIRFDGQNYVFEGGPRRVTDSPVELGGWPMDAGVTVHSVADSYRDADVVVYFLLRDGTKRPVYIDATANATA